MQWGSYELCRVDMHIVHVKIHLVNIQHPTLTYIDIIPVIPAIFIPRVLRFVDRHDSTTFTAAGTEPSAPGNSGAAGSARDVAAETGVSHQTCIGPLSIVCIMYVYIYVCMYVIYVYISIYIYNYIYIGCLILLVYTYDTYKLTGPFTIYSVIYIYI